jgi:hypothetical protein
MLKYAFPDFDRLQYLKQIMTPKLTIKMNPTTPTLIPIAISIGNALNKKKNTRSLNIKF